MAPDIFSPHPWSGLEPAAKAILQLGQIRHVVTGTRPRRVRGVLSRAWRKLLNLEVAQALWLADTVASDLAQLESETCAGLLRLEADLLHAAALALQDDSAGALAIANRVLRHSHSAPLSLHRVATTLCRLAYWKAADFEPLHSLTRNAPGERLDRRSTFTTVYDLSIEAAVEFEQLRLGAALRLARDASAVAEQFFGAGATVATLPASIAARVLYEGGHFAEAESLLLDRLVDITTYGTIETALRAFPVLARIAARRRQMEVACGLLSEAESLGERRGWPRLTASSLAERAHLFLNEGRYEQAAAIAGRLDEVTSHERSRGSSAAAEMRHHHAIVRSRLDVARGPCVGAVTTLRRLHHEAVRRRDFHTAFQTTLWIVEGLLGLEQHAEAQALFNRSLELGAALGLYEMFIDCGARVAQLLPGAYRQAAAEDNRRALLPYIGSLLGRWQSYQASRPPPTALRTPAPLSPREQHILKLIGSGLSNKQIAQTLDIAPETVKSHAKNIFVKLDVRTRTAAALRAQQRGIL